MAFLTVILMGKTNRIINFIFGAIFLVFNIFQFIMRTATGQDLPFFLIIIIISSIIASALILLYAIRWPKYEE